MTETAVILRGRPVTVEAAAIVLCSLVASNAIHLSELEEGFCDTRCKVRSFWRRAFRLARRARTQLLDRGHRGPLNMLYAEAASALLRREIR